MTSGVIGTQLQHRLLSLVDELEALRARHCDVPVWTLSPSEVAGAMERLARHRNWFDALLLTTLREADRHQVGDAVGATSTAGWWASTTRTTTKQAHRQVALATALDDDAHPPTSSALRLGDISVDQAAVILNAVEALPTDLVPHALRHDAEQHLVALAQHHDPRELRILGRRILEVIAPEIADEHERQVVEREEQHAMATASFVMNPDGHGSVVGRFKIPVLAGEMLRKHLSAIAAAWPPGRIGRRGRGGGATPAARSGVHRVRRDPSDFRHTEGWRDRRHRGGHDDPGEPPRRRQGRHSRYRRDDLGVRSTPDGL
ncbi:MAG: DUF222 domain-containing protein [Propionibacteriales bacterium]|nr:DUF222 domain-containing protein [Propionibacteriales bacterium]